ncbi:hypothetical protein [Photobacterium kishitanii]|nr:hypothetical protein [Photobacterium kishitanii]
MALLSSSAGASTPTNTDIVNLIKNHDYVQLKADLYNNDIPVLNRNDGYSILDYAMNIGDKRAAIIIADYNNSSMSERNVVKMRNSIKVLETEITKTNTRMISSNGSYKEDLQSKLKEMSEAKAKMESQINNIQSKINKDGSAELKEKVAKLEQDVKFLMSNFINADEIKNDFNEKIKSTSSLKITTSANCN